MKPYPDLIISFIDNYEDLEKVERATINLGYHFSNYPDYFSFLSHYQDKCGNPKPEHLPGRDGVLLDYISRSIPAIIIFDVSNEKIPVKIWTSSLKKSPSTWRFPVLCYMSQVDYQPVSEKNYFADRLCKRVDFFTSLETIIDHTTYKIDRNLILDDCNLQISYNIKVGIKYFNNKKYFEAHEYFEIAWMRDKVTHQYLNRSLILVSVAYFHLTRKNYYGALKILLRLRQWIYPLPVICCGINIGHLREDTELIFSELISLGPENIGKFNFSLCKSILY